MSVIPIIFSFSDMMIDTVPIVKSSSYFWHFCDSRQSHKKREIYTKEKKAWKKRRDFLSLVSVDEFFWSVNKPVWFLLWFLKKTARKSIKIDSSTLQELGVAYYLAVGVAWPPCCRSRPRLWNASLGGAKAKLKMNKKKNGLKKLSNHWWKNSRKTTL